jgi:Glyoxalase-like domain
VRIRQIALVARELEPVVEDLRAVFDLEVSFRDPGVAEFGLRNAVMPVGDTFLEVVSPIRTGTTAGRFLERRGGDGGYMVILQSDDLAADRRRVEALRARVVWEVSLSDIATIHLHPKDVGGALVSLDQPRPPSAWRWAGPGWEKKMRTAVVKGIVGAELQAADPGALARRWAELLARSASWDGADVHDIALDEGRLRFVPPRDKRGDGLVVVEVESVDRERARRVARERGLSPDGARIEIGGVRFRLV